MHPIENPEFERLAEGIYRLRIPFENIYTTVFAVEDGEHLALADSGSTPSDVTDYVLPALEKRGWKPEWLILTHGHGDHSGGMDALCAAFPQARVGLMGAALLKERPHWKATLLREGDRLWENLQILHLPGHADDALGLLDSRTGTLLSGDCLQLAGVGRYGTGVGDVAAYLNSIRRVEALAPQNLFASHDYVPLGFAALGQEAVRVYLRECRAWAERLLAYLDAHPDLTPEAAAARYNRRALPPVPDFTFAAFARYREAGYSRT